VNGKVVSHSGGPGCEAFFGSGTQKYRELLITCELLRLGASEGFLKVRIVSKRFLFERIRRSESDIEKSKREGMDD